MTGIAAAAAGPAPAGTRETRRLLGLLLCAPAVFGPVVLWPESFAWAALLTPVLLACGLREAVRLLRLGTSAVPLGLAIFGVVYVVGGAAFDMLATALHSPELDREGNPVARAFLDSGYGVPFVYGFAIVAQALLAAFTSIVWIAFLRHREALVASLPRSGSVGAFLKAALFGPDWSAGRRGWSLPRRWSDLPSPYHLFWFWVVAFVAGSSERWYLGLEWFQLIHSRRWQVIGGTFVLSTVLYLGWLWSMARRARPSSCDGDGADAVPPPETEAGLHSSAPEGLLS